MTTEEKKGGKIGGIIAIIVILLIIGGAIYYFVTHKPPQEEKVKIFGVLPQKCTMYMSIDFAKMEGKPKEEGWGVLRDMADPQQLQKLQEKTGINIEEDFLSWLGKQGAVSFLTKPDRNSPKNNKFVMVFTVDDIAKAKSKVKELIEKGTKKYKQEKYEQYTIYVPEAGNDKALSFSFVKGLFVLGTSTDEVKQCIDVANGKAKSIEENQQFTKVLKNLPSNSCFTLYLDTGEFWQSVRDKMAMRPDSKGKDFAEEFGKSIEGLGIGAGFEDDNFAITAFLGFNKDSDSKLIQAVLDAPSMGIPKTLSLFPEDTSYYKAYNVKMAQAFLKASGMAGKLPMMGRQNPIDSVSIESADGIIGADWLLQTMMSATMRMRRRMVRNSLKVWVITDKGEFDKILGEKLKGGVSEKYKEASIYKLDNNAEVAVFDKFFISASGPNAVKAVNVLIDTGLDSGKKSLANSESFKAVKPLLGENIFFLSTFNLDAIPPSLTDTLKQRNPSGGKVVDFIRSYSRIWMCSNIESEGVKFKIIGVKAKQGEQ